MSYAGICGEEHTEQSKDQVKTSRSGGGFLEWREMNRELAGDIELPGAGQNHVRGLIFT